MIQAPRSTFAQLVALFSLGCLIYLTIILGETGGHLAYLLDDTYIHLALAENLPWHMGINLNDTTDTSSSIIYPWLLVPFARSELMGTWAPFIINYISALMVLFMLVKIERQIKWFADDRVTWLRSSLLLAFAITCNIFALVFIGMEHTLHVACALALLSGLIDRIEGKPLSRLFWLAFFIGPLLRYEALAINGLILLWFALDRDWRNIGLGLLLIIPPQLIQLAYLYSLGLPLLPSSVLYRSLTIAYEVESHNALRLLVGVLYDLVNNLEEVGGFFTLILILVLFVVAIWRKKLERRLALLLALTSLAHLLVSRFGWYDRYHPYLYAIDFLGLVYLLHWRSAHLVLRTALLTLLVLCAYWPIHLQYLIPRAAAQTYAQPLQLGRFLKDYWQAPILVHDVGAISWLNDYEVIDILGLSSEKIRHMQMYEFAGASGSDILSKLAISYHADLAALYTEEGRGIPSTWVPIATLRFINKPVILLYNMDFFATSRAAVPHVLETVQAWAKTLPPGVEIGFNPAVLPH